MNDPSKIENDSTPIGYEDRKVRALEAIAGALMVIAEHYESEGGVEEGKGIQTLGDGVVDTKPTPGIVAPDIEYIREGYDPKRR